MPSQTTDKHIPSLKVVLIVSHRRPRITVVERVGNEWNEREFNAGETVVLGDPICRFALDDVFRGIALTE